MTATNDRTQFRTIAMLVLVASLTLWFMWHQVELKVKTRRYLPERQDLSMEEGRYTLEEFQDMMVTNDA